MIAAQFSDPKNARIILMAAGGLLVLAISLVVATVLWWRSSGIEPAALAPLEVMSSRQWWEGDDDSRRELLDEVRAQADMRADSAPVAESRPQPSVQSRLDRLERLDRLDQARPSAAPAPVIDEPAFDEQVADESGGFGLFDQFADDDPFGEPAPQAAAPAQAKAKRKRPVEADDLWDSPSSTSRRPVDPLLNDGDFW